MLYLKIIITYKSGTSKSSSLSLTQGNGSNSDSESERSRVIKSVDLELVENVFLLVPLSTPYDLPGDTAGELLYTELFGLTDRLECAELPEERRWCFT